MRRVRQADAAWIAAWAARDLPVPPRLEAALPRLIERLIGEETVGGMCIEELRAGGMAGKPLGVGLSGFVSDQCVTEYLDDPFPHLEVALLERARVPGSGPSLIDIEAIAEANVRGELTLCLLFWLHHCNELPDAERNALMALGQQASLRMHRGFQLKAILKDADARLAPAYVGAGFREVRRLPAGLPLPFGGGTCESERIVYLTRVEDIDRPLPGSAIGRFFAAAPPRCGFSRKQQQVLEAAVDYRTDREIAALLGTNANAVAQHWRKIYLRVERTIPLLLSGLPAGEGARGAEKRRRVVAYVAEHPEELRPWAKRRAD
jgi:hypothetical protein